MQDPLTQKRRVNQKPVLVVLSTRIPVSVDKALDKLCEKTGRKKQAFITEALVRSLESSGALC